MTEKELIQAAVEMLDKAYVPYSHFPVGAALECGDGTVYTGCNIENAAFPCTICAERAAIFKAVSEGHRTFRRIVVAGRSEKFCVPCGSCRQVMREFCQPDRFRIILARSHKEYRTYLLEELLPIGFGPDNLKNEI